MAIEAPTGFGKSWLIRKAAPAGAIRLRGELGPLADPDHDAAAVVIIDDAHLLSPDDVERLVEVVEDATPPTRVVVSGRILADPIHDVAHLVDGVVLNASTLAITPAELLEECPELGEANAHQLIDTAEGCVKVIVAAIGQSRLEPSVDVAAIATRILRSMGAASLQLLDARDAGLVSLLARAPGVDSGLLGRLGGPGFLDRVLAAGVLARRQAAGGIDLVAAGAFPTTAVDPSLASRLAGALIERGRHIEAVGLLIDAGAHERAARTVIDLPESATRSVDARTMLGLLARLGTVTEREPALLLLRAAASAHIGRVDLTGVDIEKALELSESVDPPMRRRIAVESAEWLLVQGRRDEAVARVHATISDLGPGEERTYARAHVVLADAASTSSNRADLQRAAEWYRIAAVAWDGCGETAKARVCRCDLASQVLEPLGRFDEALAQFATLLASSDISDAERAWLLLQEGFVLLSANRVDSADERFTRVADLGYLQDNPRTIAAAAWGRAMVAARREDVNEAVRLVAVAENTALGVDDDLNGVPFHCDAATALGALGEIELAERHLAAAQQRAPGYPDKVRLTTFILEARRGVRNDVAKQLAITPPVEAWRVLLVSALAAAREGSVADAQRLLIDADRELITLGFSDFRALGERRAHEELRALLRNAPADAVGDSAAASRVPTTAVRPERRERSGPTVRVVGGPIAVIDGRTTIELPAGNPQRLVGVVVAHGGLATFDQVSEAIWPGDDVEASRVRLRNVLLRLRRVAGDVVVRTAAGVKLAPDVRCDLFEFERFAKDAMAASRADPDLAGHLAQQAVELADGPIFGEFEYEEWAISARRAAEQSLIGLLDLLSVRAEDAGDLPLAQSLAERALRLDRYTDSRYVRLAELLTLQGRAAAAVAVLADASEVAKELGGTVPAGVKRRRDDIIRRSAAG